MNSKRKITKFVLKTGIVCSLVSLFFLFFFSWNFFKVNPVEVTGYFLANLGSAFGTQIVVPENPYNTLAQQLFQKEEELQEKEKVLEGVLTRMEKENKIILNFILWSMTALFVLVLLNFYFDYRTRRIERNFS